MSRAIVAHRLPRALVGSRVVFDAMVWRLDVHMIGKGVHDTTIQIDLPVDAGVGQFFLKGGSGFCVHDMIGSAMQRQHMALDVPVVAWVLCPERASGGSASSRARASISARSILW